MSKSRIKDDTLGLKLEQLSLSEKQGSPKARNQKCTEILPTVAESKLTRRVGLDCEMVGVGATGKESMVARVSVINEHGEILIDCYVKPQQIVKDYRTKISGIQPEHLENGVDFRAAREVVRSIIHGRILVGHSIDKDLMVLNLRHPKYNIRDTAHYRPIARKTHSFGTPSLKMLASALLDEDIQDGSHDSVEDARAAMKIYFLFENLWEKSQSILKV